MSVLLYGPGAGPIQAVPEVVSRVAMARNGGGGEDPSASSSSPYWRVDVPSVGAGERYTFEVTMPDGHVFTRRDPWARETDFDTDVCTVVNPAAFCWSPFARPDKDELVMYQCHIGTFTGRNDPGAASATAPGTFAALTQKLDYIAGMGFNCLQLLPHTEYGGQWGYNPRLMHAVHGRYGTPEDFAALVDASHSRGISVFVDLALHHGAANLNSLWEYDGWAEDANGGIYFEGGGKTDWGRSFAFWKDEVREYLAATVDTWLGDYNCDGVRVDSAHSLPPDFVRQVTGRIRQRFPDRVIVGEYSPEGAQAIHDFDFDAVWLLSTCDNAASMSNSWKENIGRLESLVVLRSGYTKNYQCIKFCLGSHDQCGKRPGHTHDLGYWAGRFGGHGDWKARALGRMWWGVMVAGQGIPMMFMGSETHQGGHWHTTHDTSFDWGLLEDTPDTFGAEGAAHVAAANCVRTAHKALTSGSARVMHSDAINGVLAVERFHEPSGERLICVVNAGTGQWEANGTYGINVGPSWGAGVGGAFVEVYNSQSVEFGGWAGSGNADRGEIGQVGESLPLVVPKLGVLILKQVAS
jgi:1,4-alpha-glucan branching enzyme